MSSNFVDCIEKIQGLYDSGRMIPRIKSVDEACEDLYASQAEEPDFGYDNYKTLSYRWDNGNVDMADVMEHPYDFQRWLDSNPDMSDIYLEETEYVQSILPSWALHEDRTRVKIPVEMRKYWNKKLKQLELAEKRKADALHYALYEWKQA